jgi:hypothetical protein
VFSSWTELRHHEFIDRLGDRGDKAISVGVLLTHRDDKRVWDTTMTAIFGSIKISAARLAILKEAWGDEKSAMLEVLGSGEPSRLK